MRNSGLLGNTILRFFLIHAVEVLVIDEADEGRERWVRAKPVEYKDGKWIKAQYEWDDGQKYWEGFEPDRVRLFPEYHLQK